MEQQDFYEKLFKVLEMTDENEADKADLTIKPTARDILNELMFFGDCNDGVKNELEIGYNKIKEAHLWLKQFAERRLSIYD